MSFGAGMKGLMIESGSRVIVMIQQMEVFVTLTVLSTLYDELLSRVVRLVLNFPRF